MISDYLHDNHIGVGTALRESINYLKNFFSDKNVASITPTSKTCVKRICDRMDLENAKVVVEFGPGGGVFTKYLLKKIRPDAKLIAIEINEKFYNNLKEIPEFKKDERMHLIKGSAEDARQILDDLGIEHTDYIISGVPFAFFEADLKRRIIKAATDILKPGGSFFIYQFFPPVYKKGESLKMYLEEKLSLKGKYFELPNIPPLYVYQAVKIPLNGTNGHHSNGAI